PLTEPGSVRLTGAALLAKSPDNTSTGSDFKLLLLTDEMPEGFFPWYNGWDWSGEVSPGGVCINHPEGDIKMVSTYSQAVVSVRYNNPAPDENGLYWKVNWTETQSGFGVTEGGSSGSPLLNPAGNIIGSLTGGQASCTFPEEPDYYGKFSYSWESNGSDSTRQLKYWLDPDNTGVPSLKGADFDTSAFYADFTADARKIKIGETVQFTNRSSGNINKYEWLFSGGEPASYLGENPPPIRYTSAGNFDVKLRVNSSSGNSDVKFDKAYIRVTPDIYPNPSTGKFNISFGKEGAIPETLQVYAFDITGREINFVALEDENSGGIIIDLGTQRRGMYLLKIITDGKAQVLKAMVAR
ncbi:MAG: T9SS type A sorting domain-containing protein, partial [Bacteroidales bacterium]|nr:T9SS type A sorting domain-containing protein [Bacteroidales bacterium]